MTHDPQIDPEDWGTVPEHLRPEIDSAGKPSDVSNNVRPSPCRCGFEWDAKAFPHPHDICAHAGGEYIVVCPRCKLAGTLKATPWWAIRAWNELRRMTTDPSSDVVDDVRWLRTRVRDAMGACFPLGLGGERQERVERIATTIERLSAERDALREALAETHNERGSLSAELERVKGAAQAMLDAYDNQCFVHNERNNLDAALSNTADTRA